MACFQTGLLGSVPCLVWVTEELLQPKRELLPGQVQGGGQLAAALPIPPSPLCLASPEGYTERTPAVTPKDTYAEGSGGQEDGQNDSLLYSNFNQTLQQTLIKHALLPNDNKVHVLYSYFVLTTLTEKMSVKSTAKKKGEGGLFARPKIKAFLGTWI